MEEFIKRLKQKDAVEALARDFERAQLRYTQWTNELLDRAVDGRPFVLMGEIMQTAKGKFRVEDWDIAYNDDRKSREDIYTLESYTNGHRMRVWLNDLVKANEEGKLTFIDYR